MAGLLQVRLIVRVDKVVFDTLRLVVLKVLDDLVGIRLTPVAGFAGAIGHAAKIAAVVVGALTKMLAR